MKLLKQWFKRLQGIELTQSTRRVIVAAFFVSYSLMGAAVLRRESPSWLLLEAVGFVVGPFCLAVVLSWGLPLISRKSADERQKARRNEMYTASYQVIAVLTVAAWLILGLAEAFYPAHFEAAFSQPGALIRALGFTLVSFIGLLPVMMLAWLEPDPVQEDTFVGEVA